MRRLFHNMMRNHVSTMTKPGVGELVWCSNRITRTWGVHIAPDDGVGDLFYLEPATKDDLVNFSMAVSATDLRDRVGHAAVCADCR